MFRVSRFALALRPQAIRRVMIQHIKEKQAANNLYLPRFFRACCVAQPFVRPDHKGDLRKRKKK